MEHFRNVCSLWKLSQLMSEWGMSVKKSRSQLRRQQCIYDSEMSVKYVQRTAFYIGNTYKYNWKKFDFTFNYEKQTNYQ